jgi:FkbM family methyltransferase
MGVSNFLHRQYQKWRYHTSRDTFSKRVAEINRFEKIITLEDLTFRIQGHPHVFSRKHHSFVLDQFELLLVLLTRGEIKIEGVALHYRIDGVTITITSAEEIFIIHEIFIIGTYAVSRKGEFKVIDIGLNVGIASLYFANNQQVEEIFAFEPVEPTYRQALTNFSLNPTIAKKIRSYNVGLSNENGNAEIDFSYDRKAQVGKYGFTDKTSIVTSRIAISLRGASETLTEIFQQNPNHEFVVKIDCEGAEYGVLRDLASQNLLQFIHILFIEWHHEGPQELLRILEENHFTSFHQQSASKKVGMIYASR